MANSFTSPPTMPELRPSSPMVAATTYRASGGQDQDLGSRRSAAIILTAAILGTAWAAGVALLPAALFVATVVVTVLWPMRVFGRSIRVFFTRSGRAQGSQVWVHLSVHAFALILCGVWVLFVYKWAMLSVNPFFAVNPVGKMSKAKLLQDLPPKYVPWLTVITGTADVGAVPMDRFPVVLKPNVCASSSRKVVVVGSHAAAAGYFDRFDVPSRGRDNEDDFGTKLVQELVPGREISVLVYRLPGCGEWLRWFALWGCAGDGPGGVVLRHLRFKRGNTEAHSVSGDKINLVVDRGPFLWPLEKLSRNPQKLRDAVVSMATEVLAQSSYLHYVRFDVMLIYVRNETMNDKILSATRASLPTCHGVHDFCSPRLVIVDVNQGMPAFDYLTQLYAVDSPDKNSNHKFLRTFSADRDDWYKIDSTPAMVVAYIHAYGRLATQVLLQLVIGVTNLWCLRSGGPMEAAATLRHMWAQAGPGRCDVAEQWEHYMP